MPGRVFVDTFLANRVGWRMQVPTASLDELFNANVREWLTARGVDVRTSSLVKQLHLLDDHIQSIELRDQTRITAEEFVIAVPHTHIRGLLPEQLREHPALAQIAEIESAPISSVHLWFDRAVTDLPHAALVGRLSQWMFNRGAVCGAPITGMTDTASRSLSARSHAVRENQMKRSSAKSLRNWPPSGPRSVKRACCGRALVTEHRAVFSATPGVDHLRPPQQSPVPNLQLAGDWTRTGWPATMEGAVRSGYLAAENVLRRIGNPDRVLQPDLPLSPIAKLLLGLRDADPIRTPGS